MQIGSRRLTEREREERQGEGVGEEGEPRREGGRAPQLWLLFPFLLYNHLLRSLSIIYLLLFPPLSLPLLLYPAVVIKT